MEDNLLSTKYSICNSIIHGKGLMASVLITTGEIICNVVVMIDGMPNITVAGSFVNHSYMPNSQLKLDGEEYFLVALAEINEGEEIVANYDFTPWYMQKPEDGWK